MKIYNAHINFRIIIIIIIIMTGMSGIMFISDSVHSYSYNVWYIKEKKN